MHSIYEVIAFLRRRLFIFKHSITFKKFKKLLELATLIDIRNPFFTRKIKKLNKKLLELKTCNFWLKIRNF